LDPNHFQDYCATRRHVGIRIRFGVSRFQTLNKRGDIGLELSIRRRLFFIRTATTAATHCLILDNPFFQHSGQGFPRSSIGEIAQLDGGYEKRRCQRSKLLVDTAAHAQLDLAGHASKSGSSIGRRSSLELPIAFAVHGATTTSLSSPRARADDEMTNFDGGNDGWMSRRDFFFHEVFR
jgi:hypothetical protein